MVKFCNRIDCLCLIVDGTAICEAGHSQDGPRFYAFPTRAQVEKVLENLDADARVDPEWGKSTSLFREHLRIELGKEEEPRVLFENKEEWDLFVYGLDGMPLDGTMLYDY